MDTIDSKRFLSYQQVPSEAWEIRQFRVPALVPRKGVVEASHPMMGVCRCPQADDIVVEGAASPEEEASLLARVLEGAARKWRHRPGTVRTSDPGAAERLREVLAGSAAVELGELPVLDEIVAGILSAFPGSEEEDFRPEALSGPGVTVEQMTAFAQAAVRFFEAAPWRHLSTEDLIRIESPEAEPALRYAVVMGSERSQYGLLFFDSPALWEAFATGDAETILEKSYWSVSFDAGWELVRGDLDLWERHGLPRAGDLYPVAVRLGEEVERPDAVRLAFFEGMFEALAATTEEEMDAGRWERTVTTHRGALRFTLALPDLLSERDGAIPHPEPATPMDEALDLIDEAWEARGRRRRTLARRALDLWPDCADAYVLLAGMEQEPEKERDLLAQGVAAGERALGPRMFEEQAGDFWMILESRPYMRARLGLAETLWDLGDTAEAVAHLQDMLRLNPNDNQGVRHLLVTWLLEAGRYDEAAALLDVYKDEPSAWWTYSQALLAFCQEGDSQAARNLLRTALETNRFVPKYLLDPDLLPPARPPFYRPGGEDEAILYAADSADLWDETPEALAWLSQRRAALSRSPGRKPKPRGGQAKPRKAKKKKRR